MYTRNGSEFLYILTSLQLLWLTVSFSCSISIVMLALRQSNSSLCLVGEINCNFNVWFYVEWNYRNTYLPFLLQQNRLLVVLN